MKLEDQVITLEQARRLKELGFEKDSLWHWNKGYKNSWGISLEKSPREYYPAYTVAELGEFLPILVTGKRGSFYRIHFMKILDGFAVSYENYKGNVLKYFSGMTEVEARGNMVIYLLENNFITNEPNRNT